MASITRLWPPGTRTMTSGRSRPPSPSVTLTSVAKSACSDRPQLSSTLRSCCSPQRPRALGALRSALTSLAASAETLSVPALHRLDLAVSRPKSLRRSSSTLVTPLVALRAVVDRLEQRLQIGAGILLRLPETLVGALREIASARLRAACRRSRRIARQAPPWLPSVPRSAASNARSRSSCAALSAASRGGGAVDVAFLDDFVELEAQSSRPSALRLRRRGCRTASRSPRRSAAQ